MTLADLRRFTIRKQFRVHFQLRNGMECIVTENGFAEVPALKSKPDFNLEEELAAAGQFLLESSAVPDKKNPARPRTLKRDELEQLAVSAPVSAAAPDHEDD